MSPNHLGIAASRCEHPSSIGQINDHETVGNRVRLFRLQLETVDDALDAFEHVIDLVGEDGVAVGTDFTQDQTAEWFDWLCHDS